MTGSLFAYPENAAFGRVLPKSKIYEYGKPSAAVKEKFIRQVEQIAWQYKLAPETINLAQTRAVPEIQIFSIALKHGELDLEVLRCIDKAIPFPILFELRYEEQTRGAAAYKRPSEADGLKWVVSDYFETPWMPTDTPRKALPVVLNLESLYVHLLDGLIPFPARTGETLQSRVERVELIRAKQRELERCTARLRKEKQFNRRVAINAECRAIKTVLDNLTR